MIIVQNQPYNQTIYAMVHAWNGRQSYCEG